MPSTPPDLSIVIVSYRDRLYLRECLASLRAARGALHVEVFVLDNADDELCCEDLAREHPDVSYTAMGTNAGFASAVNVGLSRATGRFVLLLNPDTWLPERALEDAVDALSRRPEAGMLGCRLQKENGELDHACKRGFPTPLGALSYFLRLDRLGLMRSRLGRYRALELGDEEESYVDAVNGAFMLVRRQALDEVGPLDERFWMYGEDIDWCLRFWKARWPVVFYPAVTARHTKGGSSGSVRARSVNWAFHKSMWLFFDKHHADQRLARVAVRFAILCKFGLSELAAGRRRPARSTAGVR